MGKARIRTEVKRVLGEKKKRRWRGGGWREGSREQGREVGV